MNKINKFLLIMSLFIFNNVNAQEVNNKFQERETIIKRFGSTNTLNIVWYTGERLEFRDILNKYLTASNSLSNSLGNNVVLLTDKSSLDASNTAVLGKHFAVYLNSIEAVDLINKGWVPVISTTGASSTVVVGRKQVQKNETGKKIVASNISHNLKIVKYFLKDKKNFNFIFNEQYFNENELITLLNDKTTDYIVLEQNSANNLISKNPNKYEIILNTNIALNNLFLISPENKNYIGQFQQGLLRLNNMSLNEKKDIFKTTGQIFKEVSQEELKIASEISKFKGDK